MPDVAEPGTDVVPADDGDYPGEIIPGFDETTISHDLHVHPAPRQYVLIAIVLVILTAFEVAASYLEGDVNSNLLIVVLVVFGAIKFFLVAAWYMHMKMDAPFFARLFTIGIIGAAIVYGIVLLVFSSTVLKS